MSDYYKSLYLNAKGPVTLGQALVEGLEIRGCELNNGLKELLGVLLDSLPYESEKFIAREMYLEEWK